MGCRLLTVSGKSRRQERAHRHRGAGEAGGRAGWQRRRCAGARPRWPGACSAPLMSRAKAVSAISGRSASACLTASSSGGMAALVSSGVSGISAALPHEVAAIGQHQRFQIVLRRRQDLLRGEQVLLKGGRPGSARPPRRRARGCPARPAAGCFRTGARRACTASVCTSKLL